MIIEWIIVDYFSLKINCIRILFQFFFFALPPHNLRNIYGLSSYKVYVWYIVRVLPDKNIYTRENVFFENTKRNKNKN